MRGLERVPVLAVRKGVIDIMEEVLVDLFEGSTVLALLSNLRLFS